MAILLSSAFSPGKVELDCPLSSATWGVRSCKGFCYRFNLSRERGARRHLHPRPAVVAVVLPCTFTHELGLHGCGLHELGVGKEVEAWQRAHPPHAVVAC
ncbi:hypothetical protein Dimus_022510 [Dionaea muscipula]